MRKHIFNTTYQDKLVQVTAYFEHNIHAYVLQIIDQDVTAADNVIYLNSFDTVNSTENESLEAALSEFDIDVPDSFIDMLLLDTEDSSDDSIQHSFESQPIII